MSKLNLRTMQDWINFSKGLDPEGRVRPKDIPSNPWTVYGPQLQQEGKKFSIREFLGVNTEEKVVRKRKQNVAKTEKKQLASKNAVTTKKKGASEKSGDFTYASARSLLKQMRAKSLADFNALIRMRLLPKQFPENPPQAFEGKWKSWKAFLS